MFSHRVTGFYAVLQGSARFYCVLRVLRGSDRRNDKIGSMPRFKLLIEYAGTRYSGWQIQKNARTVQGEIDRAVREVSKRREFELYGSGRTDAGVHALAQVAHLELYTDLAPEPLRRKLNDELPFDIHIRAIDKAPHRFHARHDALARCYLYQISRRRTAFGKPFVWWIREPLDVAAMREASAAFVGMKNFDMFTADDPDEKSTRVLVDGIEIAEAGALVLIRVQGSHFLWKMVRRMVGVLAAIGRGELKESDAARLLNEPPGATATPASLAAPAAGLFLEAVLYKGDAAPGPIRPVLNVEM
jgi:tRNA pseudouridine38-40 synthase